MNEAPYAKQSDCWKARSGHAHIHAPLNAANRSIPPERIGPKWSMKPADIPLRACHPAGFNKTYIVLMVRFIFR